MDTLTNEKIEGGDQPIESTVEAIVETTVTEKNNEVKLPNSRLPLKSGRTRRQSNNFKDNLVKTEDDTGNELQRRIHSLEKELQEQKLTSNDHQKKLQTTKFKLFETEKRLKETDQRLKQLESTLKSSKEQWTEERDKMKKQYNVLQHKFLEKQKQLDLKVLEESNEIEKIQTHYDGVCKDLETKIAELTKNNQQLLKEQKDLIDKNQALTENYATNLDNKQKQIDSVRVELKKYIELCDELEVAKGNSRKRVEESRQLLKSCYDEIANKNNKIEKLSKKLTLKEEELKYQSCAIM